MPFSQCYQPSPKPKIINTWICRRHKQKALCLKWLFYILLLKNKLYLCSYLYLVREKISQRLLSHCSVWKVMSWCYWSLGIIQVFVRKSGILLWLACTCLFSPAILNTYAKRFLSCLLPSGVLIAHPRLIIGLVLQTHYSDIWNIRMIVALDTLTTAFQHFYLWVMDSGQSALIYPVLW